MKIINLATVAVLLLANCGNQYAAPSFKLAESRIVEPNYKKLGGDELKQYKVKHQTIDSLSKKFDEYKLLVREYAMCRDTAALDLKLMPSQPQSNITERLDQEIRDLTETISKKYGSKINDKTTNMLKESAKQLSIADQNNILNTMEKELKFNYLKYDDINIKMKNFSNTIYQLNGNQALRNYFLSIVALFPTNVTSSQALGIVQLIKDSSLILTAIGYQLKETCEIEYTKTKDKLINDIKGHDFLIKQTVNKMINLIQENKENIGKDGMNAFIEEIKIIIKEYKIK